MATSQSQNINPYVAAAQDFRADIQKYFLDKGVGPDQKFAQEHNVHMFNLQRDQYRRRYQDTVADAKAAGLHPLFALGGSTGQLPTGGTAGIGARPPRASQSSFSGAGGRGRTRADEARTQEAHAKEMRLLDQKIKANDMELLAANSQAARLTQELQNSPTMARAYSARVVEDAKQAQVQAEWNRQARIRTPKGLVVIGPQGGRHPVPGGITPQQVLEDIIGEAAEGHGAATAARMYLSDTDAEKMEARIKRQVRAAKRTRLRYKRQRNPSPFTRFRRWLRR